MTTYEPVGKAASRRRGKPSAMTLREQAASDARPVRTTCLFCDWETVSTVAEARLAALEHRVAEHPERPARIKRRGQKYVAVKL